MKVKEKKKRKKSLERVVEKKRPRKECGDTPNKHKCAGSYKPCSVTLKAYFVFFIRWIVVKRKTKIFFGRDLKKKKIPLSQLLSLNANLCAHACCGYVTLKMWNFKSKVIPNTLHVKSWLSHKITRGIIKFIRPLSLHKVFSWKVGYFR